MKKLSSAAFSGIIISGLLLGACKKNKEDHKAPAGPGHLEIKLDTTYMPADKIDSAIAVWEINGSSKKLKLQISGDTLRAPLQELSEGNGQLTIQLYTKVKVNNTDLQWEKRWQFQLQHNEPVLLQGPANYEDKNWLPRVILTEHFTKFVAILAVRPEDPYFCLKNLPVKYPYIELERGYYKIPGGVEYAGYGYYKCNGTCGTDFEDRSFFANMGNMVGIKPWTSLWMGVGLFSRTEINSYGVSFNWVKK
jgi:hypothetical protein